MLHLVLYHPAIPQNTGNVARTTVGFGKPAWKIPRHVLIDRFNWRLITRHEARQLKKIQRKQ